MWRLEQDPLNAADVLTHASIYHELLSDSVQGYKDFGRPEEAKCLYTYVNNQWSYCDASRRLNCIFDNLEKPADIAKCYDCYARLEIPEDAVIRDHFPNPLHCGGDGYVRVNTYSCNSQTHKNVDFCAKGPVCWREIGERPCSEEDFEKEWTNKVDTQYGDILKRLQQSLTKNLYVKLIEGTCPPDRQVSKEDCLTAAKSVGAKPWVVRLGGDDSGMVGRPQGCTLHRGGNVDWWGNSRGNAPCGSLDYFCVCKKGLSRRLRSTVLV